MAFRGFILRAPVLHVEGMALFPFILVRSGKTNKILLNHEQIHLRQQLELGILPFYIFYLAEYFIRLALYRNHAKAYLNISFEREAYRHQHNLLYLKERKWFAFLKYL
ncbi:MAG: hypothetical protein ABS46_07720 [Cytophagaceae bacterium SCN 52-12]|nr:MAG: hypothetical protein ABS46_07720 [Cytophagaceae bacterium SCN 52-12]